jgi:hypothetical protein
MNRDAKDDKVYTEIKIDKEGALSSLKEAISKALGFAFNVGYTVKETISYFISKAAMEARALDKVIGEKEEKKEYSEGKEEGK